MLHMSFRLVLNLVIILEANFIKKRGNPNLREPMHTIRGMHKMDGVPREKAAMEGTGSAHSKACNMLIFFLYIRQSSEECVEIIPHKIIQIKLDFWNLAFQITAFLHHALYHCWHHCESVWAWRTTQISHIYNLLATRFFCYDRLSCFINYWLSYGCHFLLHFKNK